MTLGEYFCILHFNLLNFWVTFLEIPDTISNLTSLENLNLFNNELEVREFIFLALLYTSLMATAIFSYLIGLMTC